jgi:hypothetical protein
MRAITAIHLYPFGSRKRVSDRAEVNDMVNAAHEE